GSAAAAVLHHVPGGLPLPAGPGRRPHPRRADPRVPGAGQVLGPARAA
ncbi:unnamed protein product, partial [Heterosigma akashiwo]